MPKSESPDPRRARLAKALRENMKRRKAQSRGRADEASEEAAKSSRAAQEDRPQSETRSTDD